MEQREIRLKDCWAIFRRYWCWGLIVAVLFGVGAGFGTKYLVDEQYTSQASYLVVLNSSHSESNEYTDAAVRQDLLLRSYLTPGVVDLLLTKGSRKTFVDHAVAGGCVYDTSSTVFDIRLRNTGNIDAEYKYSFDMSVTTTSKEASKRVVEAFSEKANDVLKGYKGIFSRISLYELEQPTEAVMTAPHMLRNVLFAAAVGCVLTYLFFFMWKISDNTVNTEEDAARYWNKPILSRIPLIHASKQESDEKYAKLDGKLLCHHSDVFAVEESYRILRTNLIYAKHVTGTPVYGVVSAYANEGKSLSSANIAIAFAQIGRKTVIVDCDLRRATQAFLFGIEEGSHGIAEYLAGIDEEPAVMETGIENLSLLPGGYLPPDPTGLLHSDLFDKMLANLRSQYDCVIVDLPPVKLVPDALIVAGKLDGIVTVVEMGHSNGHAVREAIVSLESVGATVVGSVLNGMETKTGGRHRKFSKYGDSKGDYRYGDNKYSGGRKSKNGYYQ